MDIIIYSLQIVDYNLSVLIEVIVTTAATAAWSTGSGPRSAGPAAALAGDANTRRKGGGGGAGVGVAVGGGG